MYYDVNDVKIHCIESAKIEKTLIELARDKKNIGETFRVDFLIYKNDSVSVGFCDELKNNVVAEIYYWELAKRLNEVDEFEVKRKEFGETMRKLGPIRINFRIHY